jgi:hypothetical protein
MWLPNGGMIGAMSISEHVAVIILLLCVPVWKLEAERKYEGPSCRRPSSIVLEKFRKSDQNVSTILTYHMVASQNKSW